MKDKKLSTSQHENNSTVTKKNITTIRIINNGLHFEKLIDEKIPTPVNKFLKYRNRPFYLSFNDKMLLKQMYTNPNHFMVKIDDNLYEAIAEIQDSNLIIKRKIDGAIINYKKKVSKYSNACGGCSFSHLVINDVYICGSNFCSDCIETIIENIITNGYHKCFCCVCYA